ncbi:ankyrin repeat domain-containing protein [Ekhidna sp.]|uniref:ankyrin repeat domain-containing protein n=1 Tax=Ekhidna sp. TaxID=2608089 RepID=UPI003B59A80D
MKTLSTFMILFILGMSWSCNSQTESSKSTKVEKPRTTIQEAAFFGNLKEVKKHISSKSNLNEKDAYGSTPLHIAITFNKTDVALALIEANVDLTLTSADGSTPLHSAAFFGRTEVAKALIEKGVDINAKNSYGSTALEIVSGPFEQMKPIYDQLSKDLGPMGFSLNYDKLQEARKEIATILKTKTNQN